MVEESVTQLKKLRILEDLETAIFALERGMPAPERVINNVKTVYKLLVFDYNRTIELEAAAEEEAKAQQGGGVQPTPPPDSEG